MNLGQLINEFDNSNKTVQDFNSIFNGMRRLEGSGYVEILEPIRLGGVVRELLIDGKSTLFTFEKHVVTKTRVKKKGVTQGKGSGHYTYYTEKDGEKVKFETGKELAKFLGISEVSLSRRLTNRS